MTRDSVRTILKPCAGLKAPTDYPVHFCKLPCSASSVQHPLLPLLLRVTTSIPHAAGVLVHSNHSAQKAYPYATLSIPYPIYSCSPQLFPLSEQRTCPWLCGFIVPCSYLHSVALGHCPIPPTGLYSLCEQVSCYL